MIANTTGFDVVLDGHSHSVVECRFVKNKEERDIILSSTGARLANMENVWNWPRTECTPPYRDSGVYIMCRF